MSNLIEEVSVVPFKYKYYSLVIEMLESQSYPDISSITMKTLPKIGYIALFNGKPVAAGFLRRVEPCFAQIDTLCSNAYLGSIVRHQGIKLVVDSLVEDANRLKLKGILAFTKDSGILQRAAALGFNTINQTLISLNLSKN